jgi:hypothetical protein
MLSDPDGLVEGFDAAAMAADIAGWPCAVRVERLPAPHRPPPLPTGFGAVYAFSLSEAAAPRAPAGAGAVLKVGRVGPNSAARFTWQHYQPGSARSSLARSLLRYKIMWPWLGIDHLDEANVRGWMLQNLDRTHFYVPGDRAEVLAELEVYVRARVGSVFEGAA